MPLCQQRKAELRERRKERRRQIESGELVETTETTDEWCEDVRVADARELREIEMEKEENRKKAQNGAERSGARTPRALCSCLCCSCRCLCCCSRCHCCCPRRLHHTPLPGGSLFGSQPARERRYFKDDGTPIQMNTAKW